MSTDALAGALISGEIAGAGLDIFANEPLASNDPIQNCENFVFKLQAAYYSTKNIQRLQRLDSEEVKRALFGEAFRYLSF